MSFPEIFWTRNSRLPNSLSVAVYIQVLDERARDLIDRSRVFSDEAYELSSELVQFDYGQFFVQRHLQLAVVDLNVLQLAKFLRLHDLLHNALGLRVDRLQEIVVRFRYLGDEWGRRLASIDLGDLRF